MAIKFGMKLAEIIAQLTRGFFKQTGRSPSGLDNIKIQQEALQRFKDMNKVVDMKGNPLNPAEGIMGGEQAQNFIRKSDPALYEDRGGNIIPTQFKSETEEQIKKRLMDQNKKSLDSMKKKLDEPDDMATGGRAGYYGGGQAMVGEDLSEIGHGSDALMARNMQIAPGGQATTSTGLNYLLGQDNDTARVPYSKGKLALKVADKGRRGFMKAAGGVGAGIAALKTGLLGFGEKVAPVAKEAVEAAQSVPPYFFKLVDKIRKLGDDAPNLVTTDRQKVTKYKDFELTEDISTGEMTIQKTKTDAGEAFGYDNYGNGLTEETYMSYKPSQKILLDESNPTGGVRKTFDEYDEGTTYFRNDGPNTGEVLEEISGVSDDIFEEVGEQIPEAIRKGKADGGRIGYSKGKAVKKVIEFFKGLKKSKKLNEDEYQEFLDEVGPDQLEAYDFDGTVGDAQRIIKEQKQYMDDMFLDYKAGRLDPVAGDKSPARKRFLEKKLDEMEMSGDSKLMSQDEIEELSTFDLGTEVDDFVLSSAEKKGKKLADSMSDAEIDLRDEFPGIDDNLIKNILIDDNPQRIAEVKQTMREGLKMQEMGKGDDEILQILKDAKRTKQASGGIATMLGE